MAGGALVSAFLLAPAAGGAEDACPFDADSLSFAGSPREQARCLLRPVLAYGRLGAIPARLPAPLASLVGEPVSFSVSTLRSHLREVGVDARRIGGALDRPLSRAGEGEASAPRARYFVIHDTSTPTYERDEGFPAGIDAASWPHNDLARWTRGKRLAHVFVNRAGESTTAVAFEIPWRATKLELQVLGPMGKGLFLHVELVQPRRRDARGVAAEAPLPGFTEPQLDRLALLYAAASSRGGAWLIPAFHAVLDAGLPKAHDDPQNFELAHWAARLEALLAQLEPG